MTSATGFRLITACDHANGGLPEFYGRFWWPNGHGSHGGACEPACLVDTCVSQRILLFVIRSWRGTRLSRCRFMDLHVGSLIMYF